MAHNGNDDLLQQMIASIDLMQEQIRKMDEKFEIRNEDMKNQIDKKFEMGNKEIKDEVTGIAKDIKVLKSKYENMQKTQEYLINRNEDRERSLHYLTRYQTPSFIENRSVLRDGGESFNASPEDFEPEHPFSK